MQNPIEYGSLKRQQWLGEKTKVISGIWLWGLICSNLFCALFSVHCPSPLCKIWGAETHV